MESDAHVAALELLGRLNSLDAAAQTAVDRSLAAAARGDDASSDFWTDVLWTLIEIERSG